MLIFVASCREPARESPAPSAQARASSTAGTASPLPSASAPLVAAPLPSASASGVSAQARCPDAGVPKDSPVSIMYTQVFVASPGSPVGTSFNGSFRGRRIPMPRASAIYSWCSLDATAEPTRFTLSCKGRETKTSLCTLDLGEATLRVECGDQKHELEVPCGVRATVRTGRLPGGVSYH